MDDFESYDNEPFEPRVSEFVLDEREDACVRDSAIVDQVDDVMRVLSTQIIALHHLSLSSYTLAERRMSARLILEMAQAFHSFVMITLPPG